ncbi:hypothetical protein HYS95_03185 [Candidatus Daviesbacteria bacterium]|nr:hypothetical protein [Candidatus Daviesbacteria bacterium]
MYTTQKHLAIADIDNDILLLKDGGGALVLEVDAVNFGLLSDREQVAIISSFAQMLNSLSFSLQIVIRSQRLNINSYLTLLEKAQKAQTNPLLSNMISEYKQFIQSTIKENEVLDKNFYIVIPLFAIELGLTASKENLRQKVKTVLFPRRDQIIRQLARVGLKANQLVKKDLIETFYNIYNGEFSQKPISQTVDPKGLLVRLKQPVQKNNPENSEELRRPEDQTIKTPENPEIRPSDTLSNSESFRSRSHPFVVEELTE